MIQSNELRVNNWIYPIISGDVIETPHKVVRIANDFIYIAGITQEDGGVEMKYNEIISVPLTEEILLKCGCTPLKNNKSTYLMVIDGYVSELKIYFYLDKGKVSDIHSVRIIQGSNRNGNMLNISKLHQLQNLYFALTGKELGIKP